MYSLGKKLNLILSMRKMSKRDLAKLIGKTEHAIGKICNDQTSPRKSTILDISKVLDINPFFLTGECFEYESKGVLDLFYYLTPVQQGWLLNNFDTVKKFWPYSLHIIVKLVNTEEEIRSYLITLIKRSTISVEAFLDGAGSAYYGNGIPPINDLLNSRYDYNFNYINYDMIRDIDIDLEHDKEAKAKLEFNQFKEEYTHMEECLYKFNEMYNGIDQLMLVGESFPEPVNATELTWTNILKLVRKLDDEVWEIIIALSLVVFDNDQYETLIKLIDDVCNKLSQTE